MDLFLEKFAGKIDSESLIRTVAELQSEYVDDGITKEDLPPIITRLMMETAKFKKLQGPQKKKLVIKMINHIIDITDTPYVDDATWDPIMKQLVPKLIDTLVEVNNGKLVLKKKKCMWLRIFLPSCCCSKPSATVE